MAEAGANALFAQIVAGFDSNESSPNWPATLSTTTVYHSNGSTNYADGAYSAMVVNIPSAVTSSGSITYCFVIEGDGTSPDGTVSSRVRCAFTMSSTGVQKGTSDYSFPNDAILSNGSVNMTSAANTQDSAGANEAGIMANGEVSIAVGSAVSGSVQTSSDELSVSQASSPDTTVTQMSAPLTFPNASEVASWQASWLGSSQQTTATFPSGNLNTTGSLSGTSTITAPAYYSGDLDIGSGTTTLQPDTTAVAPYVLYVNGNINIAQGGTLVNDGVIIVCNGTVTCSSGTTYETSAPTSSALIDLNSNPASAVSLAGASSADVGLIYTPNGGVTLNNAVSYTGTLISGDSGGSVSLSGGAVLIYSDNQASQVPFVPITNGANFTPSTLGTYYRML